MFAPKPDAAGAQLLEMYQHFNQRLAQTLLDHEWDKMLEEEGTVSSCSYTGCIC